MKINVIDAGELSYRLVASWRELQGNNPLLRNPYFCPEFTQGIADARSDVRIAAIEIGGRVVAFFPYQLRSKGLGEPVGGFLSDYQGLICEPSFTFDPEVILKACGLKAWDFDHLLADQTCFKRFHRRHDVSLGMDLRGGFKHFLQNCHAARAEQIKVRRLEREVGPVRMVTHTLDRGLFDLVLRWKTAQYLASGRKDILGIAWVRKALQRIRETQGADFSGILTVLFAGDTPVAGHFGMRSRTVWHYWFPSYAVEFSRYSPGTVLLLKMAEAAETLGVTFIDFGKGAMLYKERFSNAVNCLAEGSIAPPSFFTLKRRAREEIRKMGRGLVINMPFEKPLRQFVRLIGRR